MEASGPEMPGFSAGLLHHLLSNSAGGLKAVVKKRDAEEEEEEEQEQEQEQKLKGLEVMMLHPMVAVVRMVMD